MNEENSKNIFDKTKKLHEITEAKNDLKKIEDCINYLTINNELDSNKFDHFIQEIVDKYRSEEIVGDFYNSPIDSNKIITNYQSLLNLRNMVSSYIERKVIADTIDEVKNN